MDVVVRSENQLGNYDAMCTAIAECHKVDEVAEMRNQARAMEVYAKQAMNFEAERQAIEVRIRAERRAGQLLSGMERNQGANNQYALGDNEPKHSEFKQAKLNSGIKKEYKGTHLDHPNKYQAIKNPVSNPFLISCLT